MQKLNDELEAFGHDSGRNSLTQTFKKFDDVIDSLKKQVSRSKKGIDTFMTFLFCILLANYYFLYKSFDSKEKGQINQSHDYNRAYTVV